MFGRRSIPSGSVARPFHTESMRSPRALPDERLNTQTEEVILARTLSTKGWGSCYTFVEKHASGGERGHVVFFCGGMAGGVAGIEYGGGMLHDHVVVKSRVRGEN